MDRNIRLAFSQAVDTANSVLQEAEPSKREEKRQLSLQLLTKALTLLSKCRQTSCHSDSLILQSPELLVISAEACLVCGETRKAKDNCRDYFKQVRGDNWE